MPQVSLRSVISLFTLLFVWSFGLSLPADETSLEARGIEFFEQNIRPLLIEHCYECHAGDEDNGELQAR